MSMGYIDSRRIPISEVTKVMNHVFRYGWELGLSEDCRTVMKAEELSTVIGQVMEN